MPHQTKTTAVPKSMQEQLARLLGGAFKEARSTSFTDRQWCKTLALVLRELDRYLEQNVDTDDLHYLMLLSGLAAADESLTEKNFWPGYAEGITRVALLLMGNYPDHKKRKLGRKKEGHYKLNTLRSVHWSQTADQRLRTLLVAGAVGFPQLSVNPREALSEFRMQHGYHAGYKEFLDWFRKTYPRDYASVFR